MARQPELRTVEEAVRRISGILIPALVVAAFPAASRAGAQEAPTPVAEDALSGAEAFLSLVREGELADVAADIEWSPGQLATALLTDDALFVTDQGDVGYADEARGPGELAIAALPPAYSDAQSVFTLHSRPSAPLTILLDFDGHVTTHTAWNRGGVSINSAPFGRDSTTSSLSVAEVAEIEAVWRIVAEDFAPFDVDVTTVDPGEDALQHSGAGDVEYGTRIVISPTDDWFGDGYGGVAYIGSFKSDNPAFVFSDNLGSFKSIGDAASHETGHTLALRHDGTSAKSYYSGHGTWGPIMGTSYSRVLAQWSRGEYAGANNDEDDLEVLTDALGHRVDDHGDTASTATLLAATGETAGFVGGDDPVDVFAVDVVAGALSARITPASTVTNLFASVTIRNAAGEVVVENVPTAVTTESGPSTRPIDWSAVALTDVPAGRYTVEVRPAGLATPSTGFSTYGSNGGYRLTVAFGTGSPPLSPGLPGRVRFTPIEPLRVADTRSGNGGAVRLAADGVLRVVLAGAFDVPPDATAVALNVTAVGPDGGGFLTVYPCTATVPTTSTVNFAASRDIANATIATLASDGSVCVYSSVATNVLVDITGWLSTSASTLMSPTMPHRVADTRSGVGSGRLSAGGVLTVEAAGAGVSAVALNVTAVDAAAAGFLTVYPCDTAPPIASTVNFAAHEARPNNAIVALAHGGLVCVFSSAAVDVVVDVTAVFSTAGMLGYLPADPQRLIDTRTTGEVSAGGQVAFGVPSPGAVAGAVSVNVTAVGHDVDGFATAFGCGADVPEASTLNQRVGEANANGAIVPAGTDSTGCVFASSATNVIVDLTGWWVPAG
jgi:hypothetical protein